MKPQLRLHALQGNFEKGDEVIDLTAQENGWPDVEGIIEEIDGSHVLVRYISGQTRAKMHINLRLKNDEAEKKRLEKL